MYFKNTFLLQSLTSCFIRLLINFPDQMSHCDSFITISPLADLIRSIVTNALHNFLFLPWLALDNHKGSKENPGRPGCTQLCWIDMSCIQSNQKCNLTKWTLLCSNWSRWIWLWSVLVALYSFSYLHKEQTFFVWFNANLLHK